MRSSTLVLLALCAVFAIANGAPMTAAERAAARQAAINARQVSAAERSRINDFRSLLRRSRIDCRRQKPAQLPGRCPASATTPALIAQIPGGRDTVRMFTSRALLDTIDLCAARESTGAASFRTITQTRGKMGLTLRDEQWTECKAQMDDEKKDCKNVREVLCALGQGSATECASDQLTTRRAKTLDRNSNGDQCFALVDFAFGRPEDAAAFRKRLRTSKTNCRKDKDVIKVRCRNEKSINHLLATLPAEIKWDTYARQDKVLAGVVEQCRIRETEGWTQLRQQAVRTLKGAERRDCIKELNDARLKECKEVTNVVCAFSYGTDLSCASDTVAEIHATTGQLQNACKSVDNAVQARRLTGRK